MDTVRVVFMGSQAPAIPVLVAVRELGWDVVGVYTTPDQPAGRGRRWEPTPVKRYAQEQGLRLCEPSSLRGEAAAALLRGFAPDLVVLAAYGKLLPQAILEMPPWLCVNVHPSLLPRHRGASPVAATILAGDTSAGATLFVMNRGLDTGPILAQRHAPVYPDDRTPELTERLFVLGAELLRDVLPEYVQGRVSPVPQMEEEATVTQRLSKGDGELEWAKSAEELQREVRAYFPWPGSTTRWDGKRLQVLRADVELDASQADPGTVVQLSTKPTVVGVVTAHDTLVLKEVRLEGRPAMEMADFLRGHPEFVGVRLPS
jgi:methionyl-tRNA formyltransferase